MYDILCAGIATWDTLLTGIEEDLMEIDGITAKGYTASPGGDAINASVTCARLGLSVCTACCTGKDQTSDLIEKALQKEGISTEGIVKREDVRTASPVLLIDTKGERHIIRVPDHGNLYFSESMISDMLLSRTRHLHVASLNMLEKLDGDPLGRLFTRAHSFGVTTSMDASFEKNGRWRENAESALQNCDIFMPSLQEARMYAQSDDPEEIADYFSHYPIRWFGIKLGEKGCFGTDFSKKYYLPSLYKGIPVDTTGAGDAFLAGVVTGYLKGLDLKSSLLLGSAQSASVMREVGATVSAGTFSQAEEMIKQYNEVLAYRRMPW